MLRLKIKIFLFASLLSPIGVAYADECAQQKNDCEKFKCYEAKIKAGDARAKYQLGLMYEKGYDCPRDLIEDILSQNRKPDRKIRFNQPVKAYNLYEEAAKEGIAEAQYKMGRLKHNIDYEQAFEWYNKAAEQGYQPARDELNKLKTERKNFEDLEKQALFGNGKVQYELAIKYKMGEGVKKDPEKMIQLLTESAKRGYPAAQRELGVQYYIGVFVKKDIDKSLELLNKAIKQGDVEAKNYLARVSKHINKFKQVKESAIKGDKEAQFQLAEMYREGIYVPQDLEKANEWYEKAEGYSQAKDSLTKNQKELGRRYENGIGVEEDKVKSFIWYKKAAEQGDADAQYKLARLYDELAYPPSQSKELFEYVVGKRNRIKKFLLKMNGDEFKYIDELKKEAAKWYKKAAEQGHLQAQSKLGKRYSWGIGIKKDYIEAYKWSKKAAERGDREAARNLSFMRSNFPEVEKLESIKKAAEEGDSNAQYRMGQFYRHGSVFSYDNEKAFELYKKAAEQGHKEAQKDLAYCYQNGIGVERNNSEAVRWYEKAAAQGDDDAQRKVKSTLVEGEKLESDKRQAESGDMIAQYAMGKRYYFGRGVEQDIHKAIEWWEKSAEQGHIQAQKDLVTWCGFLGDVEKAAKWAKRAAGQGDFESKYHLARHYYFSGDYSKIFDLLTEAEKGASCKNISTQKWRKVATAWQVEVKFLLGFIYFEGSGVSKDYNKSNEWFMKAVECENSYEGAGLLYHLKKVRPASFSDLIKWLRDEEKNGNQDSIKVIKYLESKGLIEH